LVERTLLLNTSYEPLLILGWQRALTLVVLGKAEVVSEYTRLVRCKTHRIRVPSVIRLRRRVPRVRPMIRFLRSNLYARDGYQCQYCGDTLSAKDLTYDHVIPRSKGGLTCWTNIVSCCVRCNRKKGSLSLEEAGMRLLKRPVRPRVLPDSSVYGPVTPESWRFYLRA